MAWDQISTKDFLRVRGIGVVPANVVGQTRRRALSREAAIGSARYQLLATIRGIKLEAGITVSELIERDSLIREIADDIVKGGDEVLTEWLSDDGCVATLELRRSKVEHLIQKKTEHEKDLEQRVVTDLEEIERLNKTLEALTDPSVGKEWNDNARVEFYAANDVARRLKRAGRDVDPAVIKRMIEEDVVQHRAYLEWHREYWCKLYPKPKDCFGGE